MVGALPVEVRRGIPGHDRLESRRLLRRDVQLHRAEVRDSDHADVAVAPVLLRDPLHEVVSVLGLLLRHPPSILAFGVPDPAHVRDDVDVAVAREEPRVASLDTSVPQGRRGRLWHLLQHLLRLAIGRVREQRRIPAVEIGSMDVGGEPNPVPHRDHDVQVGLHAAVTHVSPKRRRKLPPRIFSTSASV